MKRLGVWEKERLNGNFVATVVKKALALALALAMTLTASACSPLAANDARTPPQGAAAADSGAEPVDTAEKYDAPAAIEPSLKITNPSDDTQPLYVGKRLRCTADLQGATGQLAWSTSDASVATISGEGDFEALKPGEVTISVTSGELRDNISLTIHENKSYTGENGKIDLIDKDGYTYQLKWSLTRSVSYDTTLGKPGTNEVGVIVTTTGTASVKNTTPGKKAPGPGQFYIDQVFDAYDRCVSMSGGLFIRNLDGIYAEMHPLHVFTSPTQNYEYWDIYSGAYYYVGNAEAEAAKTYVISTGIKAPAEQILLANIGSTMDVGEIREFSISTNKSGKAMVCDKDFASLFEEPAGWVVSGGRAAMEPQEDGFYSCNPELGWGDGKLYLHTSDSLKHLQ
jgi:hypothetical protein